MKARKFVVALIALVMAVGAATSVTALAQKAPSQTPSPAAALAPAGAPVLGPVNAPVTIVEFFDPACEACRAMYPYVKQILAKNPKNVRLVIRYVPFHGQVSREAIRVLEAARQQKRFVQVLDALMQHQPTWASHGKPSPEKVWEYAIAAGLNRAQANTYLTTGAVEAMMKREVAAVESTGIRGTPTFFVNGKQLEDLGPEQLAAMVNAEVQRVSK